MKHALTIKKELARLQGNLKSRCLTGMSIDNFYSLIKDARKFCKKYDLNFNDFEIEVNGGGVPNSYGYRAETTVCRLLNGNPHVSRVYAKKAPYGKTKNKICRIKIGKDHPARKSLIRDGLIKSGKYINLV